jgi:phosphohistidine swiveling domain-containing protein
MGPSIPDIGVDPVNSEGGRSRWTTVNAGEALPGVVTPLTWTVYFPAVEYGVRKSWAGLGALPASGIHAPLTPDECFNQMFAGRMAINLDRYCSMADGVPGTSGIALEEHLFGAGTDREAVATSRPRRYGIVAAKAPVNAVVAYRRLAAITDETPSWRHARLNEIESGVRLHRLREIFAETRVRLENLVHSRVLLTMVGQGCYERVAAIAESVGHPELAGELAKSSVGTDEFHMVADLWSVSRGEMELAAFIDRHGHHGPDEGLLTGRVWREDPAPLHALLKKYESASQDNSPLANAERRLADHKRARDAVLAEVGPVRARVLAPLLKLTGNLMVLRERGKTSELQIIDVARASARALGLQLASAGSLADPDDIFFLTADELIDPSTGDLKGRCATRRTQHQLYLATSVPLAWTGKPDLVAPVQAGAWDGQLEGLGASPGTVEGLARVVHDPNDDFESDEILVCHTTDPGWAPLFLVAAAVVVDVGGSMSHGSIVARELGIPCVTNTRIGTTAVRTGDRLRVDGATGRVERLAVAEVASK